MGKICASVLILAFCGCSAYAVDDVAGAAVVTVKAIDKAGKTAVMKTADGTEYTVHFVGRTVAHGAEATGKGAKDAFEGMKEGDDLIVHYTEKAGAKTAEEIDHIGKGGLKMTTVAMKSVDHAAKTVTVKTESGAEETYHLTDRAAKETGKGLDKAGKVTIYYTEDAGKKVAHYFKQG